MVDNGNGTNSQQRSKPTARAASFAIGLLALALIAVLFWFGSGLRSLYRSRPFAQRMSHTVAVSQIQSWMTFRYVDFVFHLPPGYLASSLGITNQKYLDSTLSAYAASSNLSSVAVVQSVKNAVALYQNQVHQSSVSQ